MKRKKKKTDQVKTNVKTNAQFGLFEEPESVEEMSVDADEELKAIRRYIG